MNSFEEKREQRIERFRNLAIKKKQLGNSLYDESNKMVSHIPFGQPILVGHHSENAHRRLLQRSRNKTTKAFQELDKSKYYEEKVNNLENDKNIYSDDPEALKKLREKLSKLEEQREEIKSVNKAWRKYAKKKDDSELKKLGFDDKQIKIMCNKIEEAYSWEKQPYPKYMLSNLGQNINSVKKRIIRLENINNIEGKEWKINETTVKINKEDNRIRIFFPDKPNSELRTELKRNGFRWSLFNKAWQTQIHLRKIIVAKELAGKY